MTDRTDVDELSELSELFARAREIRLLHSCGDLLGWDEETMMPKHGAEHRGKQQALLAGIARDRLADPRLGELAQRVAGDPAVADVDRNDARELARLHRRATRMPKTLLEEQKRIAPLAIQAWIEARHANDATEFLPWLKRTVELKQREAQALSDGEDRPHDRYGALLDDYEPGMGSADVQALLDGLVPSLTALVQRAQAAPRRGDSALLKRRYPLDRQRVLSDELAVLVGYDLHGGRIDTTTHPFCSTIGPGDVRIATRFAERELDEGLYSTMHELGHALYEQGLPEERFGLPSGTARSLGLHESQSRLWENAIGRSLPSCRYLLPRLRALFHGVLDDVTDAEQLYRAVNAVEPGTNRVRADEVTYNLHIAVRFDLERALLDGSLPVADVAAAWREAYQRVLGVRPANDLEGVLQDGHWAAGMFGYFPTYTLGNVMAAQLFAALKRELPEIDVDIERGRLAPVLQWLRRKVHVEGGGDSARAIVERASGQPLSSAALLAHLEAKVPA